MGGNTHTQRTGSVSDRGREKAATKRKRFYER